MSRGEADEDGFSIELIKDEDFVQDKVAAFLAKLFCTKNFEKTS